MAAQLPDIIFYNDEKLELYSNPLESYWSSNKKRRPTFQVEEECRRGYIATWEIIDKLLILREIDGNVEKRFFLFWRKIKRYSMKMLFPAINTKGVVASWFTGKIRIPQGKMMFYVHQEYDSRFEREMVITIERGKVLKTVVLDYREQTLQVESR